MAGDANGGLAVRVIDISLPIEAAMVVFEGDPDVGITPYLEIARGDPANVSLLTLGSHTGTHLDAPAHFLVGGATLEGLSLETLVGPALVAEVTTDRTIGPSELDGARYLVERGIRLVGIDYLSIEAFDAPGHPVHRLLLGAGVVILEGLCLTGVEPGVYELLCLPLPVKGIDGAPCRAVLRA